MPALVGLRPLIEAYIYENAEQQCGQREQYSAEPIDVSLAIFTTDFLVMLIEGKVLKTFHRSVYKGTDQAELHS